MDALIGPFLVTLGLLYVLGFVCIQFLCWRGQIENATDPSKELRVWVALALGLLWPVWILAQRIPRRF